MPNIQDTTFELTPQGLATLHHAGRLAHEHRSELSKAAASIDERYSEKRTRADFEAYKESERLSHAKEEEEVEKEGRQLTTGIEWLVELEADVSPRARFSRAVADQQGLDTREIARLGKGWALKIMYLNLLLVDEIVDSVEPTSEFQQLQWDANTEIGEFRWQGRQVTADAFLDGKWMEVVNTAVAVLGWEPAKPQSVDSEEPTRFKGTYGSEQTPAESTATSDPVEDDSDLGSAVGIDSVPIRYQLEGRGDKLTLRLRLHYGPNNLPVIAPIKGRTSARLLWFVLSQPQQSHTWKDLLVRGMNSGYWVITATESLERTGRNIREKLPPELRGYWEQNGTGVRWASETASDGDLSESDTTD